MEGEETDRSERIKESSELSRVGSELVSEKQNSGGRSTTDEVDEKASMVYFTERS